MKLNELRRLTDQELLRESDDRMKELFNLRYQAGTEQLENPALMRETRREIARIKTILRERELEKKE
ncbi:MAG TPA: 50S ribosomal protein L29 [Planctomycetota bacterium]|nr:50S ribosomal protein L29 [Planctomycetota bacterium]HRR81403.1 50S ribosomal protein L29 [Planctomycetota bacterium]HRT94758.1 50S ribosomal protein L29 [Planctomycetota bacterium]